jgi:hypothetical protein
MRRHLYPFLAYVALSACFSVGVYKIDNSNIGHLQQVQAHVQQNGARIQQTCLGDLAAINAAHHSIKHALLLDAEIAQSNITGIHYGLNHNLIPPSLDSYYKRALIRQSANRDRFERLARSIRFLKNLCS